MSSIPATLFKSFSKMEDINVCFNNVVSMSQVFDYIELDRAYVKKTDDINTLNNARSHTDGVIKTVVEQMSE